MDTSLLSVLAKQLNLTSPNDQPDEYILTEDEEKKVIAFELEQAKKLKAWRFAQMGLNEFDIAQRMEGIDWEDYVNREEILQRANSNKTYDLWQKEQRKKDAEQETIKRKELQARCNAKYFFNLMSWNSKNRFGKQLIVNEDNKRLITAICFFLSNDGRFETELGYSFQKGLLIRGVSGLGKTFLVKCIADNELKPISIYSTIDINEELKQEGEYEINTPNVLYLDDVGTEEPIVNYYGTKLSWFKNFIELYYSKHVVFNRLLISTNNNFKEMEDKYGFRVRSRIKDMFNIIDVTGTDMRGMP